MRCTLFRDRAQNAVRLVLLTVSVALTTAGGCGTGASTEQKQAFDRVHELGGQVNYDRGGYEVSLSGTAVENDDLAHLKHIANLRHLDLRSTQIDDGGVIHLEVLKSLQDLQLARTRISAESIAKLRAALPQTDVER